MTSLPLASTVLLYATVDTFNLERGPTAFALSLCKALGGGLTGCLLNLDANAPVSPDRRSLEQMKAVFRLREATNFANAEALLARASQSGISAVSLTEIDYSRGVLGWLADHARIHDVVVIGTDRRGMMSDRLIAENLLFEIGRPMLAVPGEFVGEFACQRIAVAWDNSRVAARALGDALSLNAGINEVIFLTIGGEKAIHSSLDDDAMKAALERRGVAVCFEHSALRGRSIGMAIQEAAEELDPDLLVMGGYGHSRLRDFILGGATLEVLGELRMPVLLSH